MRGWTKNDFAKVERKAKTLAERQRIRQSLPPPRTLSRFQEEARAKPVITPPRTAEEDLGVLFARWTQRMKEEQLRNQLLHEQRQQQILEANGGRSVEWLRVALTYLFGYLLWALLKIGQIFGLLPPNEKITPSILFAPRNGLSTENGGIRFELPPLNVYNGERERVDVVAAEPVMVMRGGGEGSKLPSSNDKPKDLGKQEDGVDENGGEKESPGASSPSDVGKEEVDKGKGDVAQVTEKEKKDVDTFSQSDTEEDSESSSEEEEGMVRNKSVVFKDDEGAVPQGGKEKLSIESICENLGEDEETKSAQPGTSLRASRSKGPMLPVEMRTSSTIAQLSTTGTTSTTTSATGITTSTTGLTTTPNTSNTALDNSTQQQLHPPPLHGAHGNHANNATGSPQEEGSAVGGVPARKSSAHHQQTTERKCMAEMEESLEEASKNTLSRKLGNLWMDTNAAWKSRSKRTSHKMKMHLLEGKNVNILKRKKKKKQGILNKVKALFHRED